MKKVKSFVFVFIMVTASFCGKAQTNISNACGLYASAADFLNHTLTCAFDCNSHKDKLHLNDLLGGSKGYVLQNGQKHFFKKQEIYGYRYNKKDYRFYNNKDYRIIDTAGFYMYYQYEQEQPVKGKEMVKTDEYFFSKEADSKLQLLTIDNLEQAFPDNSKFHYAIDETFKSDKDLIAYDHFLNTYKIKYLFIKSAK